MAEALGRRGFLGVAGVVGLPDYLVAVSAKVQGVQAAPPNTLDQGRFDKVWLA